MKERLIQKRKLLNSFLISKFLPNWFDFVFGVKQIERNPKSFYNWAVNNGYKKGLSIERIDVNGNYEPNNCKWIERGEQSKNRRTSIPITYNGETHILSEWSEITGIDYRTIKERIKRYGLCDKVFKKGNIRSFK